jgi:prepilin-type N-terminal cleavage/methylation domain-containing protein
MTQYYDNKKDISEYQSGLTLVELLISMVIAVIIGLAVFSTLYTMYNSRALSEKLTGRSDRAILMKEALEHTVTNAGYTAYTSSPFSSCPLNKNPNQQALPITATASSVTVYWTVNNGGACDTCSGTFSISGNIAAWSVSGVNSCGQSSTNQQAVFPVGTGWTISTVSSTNCLGPAFNNTTAPAVIATNISSQDSGTNPVEVSACLFNLQGH